jgi:hypothetical protein
MRKLLYTLLALFSFYAAQAQTRMWAEAHLRYNDQLAQDETYDSIAYTYISTSGRGCAPYEEHNFDTSYRYYTGGATPVPTERKIQWFDAQDRITTRLTENFVSGGWQNYIRESYTYDAGGGVATDTTEEFFLGNWQPTMANLYVYNNVGTHIQVSYTFSWNSSTLQCDTTARHVYNYDGNGNAVQIIGSGHRADTLIIEDSTYLFYNSNNLCIYKYVRLLDNPSLNTWMNGQGIANKYTATNKIAIQYQLTDPFAMGHIDTTYRYVNTYDASDDLINTIYGFKDAGVWLRADSNISVYNSDHHVTYERDMQWDGFAWVNTIMSNANKYYYGPYTPTAVANLRKSNTQLQLYPVPANNTLHLQLTEDKQQLHTVAITDMQGKQILHETYISNTTQSIDISSLPTGVYNISLLSTKGSAQHGKFTVVR